MALIGLDIGTTGSKAHVFSDDLKLLASAMQAAGSADPKQYLPALKAIQYQGASGKVVFDDKGDRQNAALTLYTFKAGQREKLAVIR